MTTYEKAFFKSGADNCCGLYYPAQTDDKSDCIVMAHGLSGVKELRLQDFAERFAAAGHSVFLFDYRFFGESGGEPRQIVDINCQHEDWLAAIDYVKNHKGFSEQQIVLWGSSLSGGHVIETASKLTNLKAVIAQVPHVNGLASGLAGELGTTVRLTVAGIKDIVGNILGKPPLYVNAAGQPGELALMTSPEAAQGYLDLIPAELDFDQRVAARFVLDISLYNPGSKLKSLTMPILIQVGLKDTTTPPKTTINYCKKAPKVTLKTYDVGHFEPYVGSNFETFIADQIAFLDQ